MSLPDLDSVLRKACGNVIGQLLTAKKLFSQIMSTQLNVRVRLCDPVKIFKRCTAYLCDLECLFKLNESHLRQTRKHGKSPVYNVIITMYAFAQRSIFSMFYE